nr:uncharacterized protein LOC123763617 [Procambarus clarkii]XP_045606799.1 uncharacterized protein LOC123763617 [Procambarus clarkii]XP_045606800.1 uncharacterized protein LOC123763617 [Procambarus clarkii]XP_045606801.1 uncharacterized protein LOC123763617 [Procambarus clarkii]
MSGLRPPPPTYEEAMLGRPQTFQEGMLGRPQTFEEAMMGRPHSYAPFMFHPHPTACLHYYVFESTVPSAPPLSYPGSPSVATIPNNYVVQRSGLDLIASLHQVCLSSRQGDSYVFTDITRSLLYTATIATEVRCWCCAAPTGPGITFNLTSRNGHHALVVQRLAKHSCCSSTETNVTVCIPPDVTLGTVDGMELHCVICNSSGDVLCDVEQEEVCCSCTALPYQVTPNGYPHDKGSIAHSRDGLLITFPAVFDLPTRTLLLCCALNLQYGKELQRREGAG